MSGRSPVPAPCPRCTGPGDAHYLTCPTLRPVAAICDFCGGTGSIQADYAGPDLIQGGWIDCPVCAVPP